MNDTGDFQVKLRIGHEAVSLGAAGSFEHRHPATGASQALVPLAGASDVDRAVARAKSAADGWRRTRPEARRTILLRLADLLAGNADEIARLAMADGGVTNARRYVDLSIQFHNYYAGWCDKIDGQVFSTPLTRGELTYSVPEPFGVVGVIITWNSPIGSLGMKVPAALAAGNCVIVKPSELTPFVPDLYARLAQEAGVPDGVLSVLPGGADAGAALVAHPDVELISFTGGPDGARKILAMCAEQMKPAVLELGGKSAVLVFPDVDVETICRRLVQRVMGTMAGQGCSLPTRVLVHESVYDQAVSVMAAQATSMKVGLPQDAGVEVGPVISAASCDRILGMLERARAEGVARIVCGGRKCGGDLAAGNFIEPTIVADVDPSSEIGQAEVFGPVMTVMRFADEDEAVALANSTRYGLASYIYTHDIGRVHRLVERLRSGGVYVNGGTTVAPHAPFGGLDYSGYGKEGGRAGLDEFLRYKTVSVA